jgi:hypothetical protein
MTNLGRGTAVATALIAGWLAGGGLRTERLQAETASSDAAPALTVMALPNGQEHVVYVLDGKKQAVSVYAYDVRKEKMRLSAVRRYAADHRLSEYNNEQPSVADIERLTRQR